MGSLFKATGPNSELRGLYGGAYQRCFYFGFGECSYGFLAHMSCLFKGYCAVLRRIDHGYYQA